MIDQKTYLNKLGQRLATLRKEQGLTQQQLGKAAGVTQQVIAEYEAGYRNIPVYRLAKLAEALGVKINDILQESCLPMRKRGPASKFERLSKQITKLPRSQQQFVVDMIEDAVARANS